jgi:hypothetical protein
MKILEGINDFEDIGVGWNVLVAFNWILQK